MDTAAPTVLWRLFQKAKGHVRAVILPGGPPYTLAFFVDDQLDRAENYDEMPVAIFRAQEVKRSLTSDGWMEEQ